MVNDRVNVMVNHRAQTDEMLPSVNRVPLSQADTYHLSRADVSMGSQPCSDPNLISFAKAAPTANSSDLGEK